MHSCMAARATSREKLARWAARWLWGGLARRVRVEDFPSATPSAVFLDVLTARLEQHREDGVTGGFNKVVTMAVRAVRTAP